MALLKARLPKPLIPDSHAQRALYLARLRQFGIDAASFQGLESGMSYWFDAPPPGGSGNCVAYADTGTAWVAAGGPVGPEAHAARAAERFIAAAQCAGRRASFFATERRLAGFDALWIGEQPVFSPARWLRTGARSRGMREQLRRARAKGVQVRRVEAEELRAGSPLRAAVEALADAWLRSRAMEPMRFLVAVEPFWFREEHRYFVAELDGRTIAFLSAVPMYARRGWLV